VTDEAGVTFTVLSLSPGFLHVQDEHGTPNELFTIDDSLLRLIPSSQPDQRLSFDQSADHVLKLMKKFSKLS
jgi:hypothetical protein